MITQIQQIHRCDNIFLATVIQALMELEVIKMGDLDHYDGNRLNSRGGRFVKDWNKYNKWKHALDAYQFIFDWRGEMYMNLADLNVDVIRQGARKLLSSKPKVFELLKNGGGYESYNLQ